MTKTAVSGLAATVIDFGVLIALAELAGMGVGVAAFIAAMAGAGLNFFINKYWAFEDSSKTSPAQVASFTVVALVTAVCTGFGTETLAAHMPYVGAKMISATVLFFVWTYPTQSRVVFSSGRASLHAA